MKEFPFDKNLFWDVDIEKADLEKNARFIVARVLMRGNLNDWFKLKQIYGIERLKQIVVDIKYLDEKTLNFCSVYFNIPKNQFKCYTTPSSLRKLWDF